MLHLIPAPLGRLIYRAADRLRRVWWRITRPDLTGCRAAGFDGEGRVLLVRHSYGSGVWTLPGGGMARGEDAVAAAERELGEETGCALRHAREADMLVRTLSGASNRIHIIVGRLSGTPRADGREIVEARLFGLDELPADLPEWVRSGLPAWATAAKAEDRPLSASPPAPPPAPTA